LALLGFVFWIGKEYNSYFVPKYNESLPAKTANGNPYSHSQDGFIENGFFVNQYLCEQELSQAWFERMGFGINDIFLNKEGSFSYHDMVVRYLNSKGLHKDAQGIKALSEKDICNIKEGYANAVYAEKFSLRPRLYMTFFEFERYIHAGSIKGYSVIQRIELCKNALQVINDNTAFGVGTGDVVDNLNIYLDENPSKNSFDNNDPHNFFIYIMVGFGVFGLAVLLFFIIYPPTKQRLWTNQIFSTFFIITICSMFVESYFNLSSAMVFYCMFSNILLFNDKAIRELYQSNSKSLS
jgi:hypothetical protein